MVTNFWVFQGIILINYLEKGKTITSIYYVSLLDFLNTQLQEKHVPYWPIKLFFFVKCTSSIHCNYGREINGFRSTYPPLPRIPILRDWTNAIIQKDQQTSAALDEVSKPKSRLRLKIKCFIFVGFFPIISRKFKRYSDKRYIKKMMNY